MGSLRQTPLTHSQMTSLGFRPRNDHIAERPRPPPPKTPLPVVTPEPSKRFLSCQLGVPRGLLPVLSYSALAMVLPLVLIYQPGAANAATGYNLSDDVDRGIVIGLAGLAATVVVLVNDCCCWFNMVLFFHTALEVRVVDNALTFAYAAGQPSFNMAWAIAGAVIVIVHLIPFFLTDRLLFLTLLAYVGVFVNAALNVYITPAQPMFLLLVGASSLMLLAMTMIVAGVCEIRTSILSLLRCAITECQWITFGRFEL